MTETRRNWASAALTMIGTAFAGSAAADDLYGSFATPHTLWGVFAGAEHTSDATLTPGGPSDTIETVGLNASLYETRDRLIADVEGSIHNEYYADHTFADHTIGQLNARASFAIVPQQFNWVLTDNYGQVSPNPITPQTPANRINANSFSTGPDGDLNLGNGLDVLLGARYGQSDFGNNAYAPVSTRTVSGNVGLRERLSPTSSASINITDADVRFQEGSGVSYRNQELFVRYDTRSRVGGFALDAGATRVDEFGSASVEPLARLTFFQRLTGSWNVNVTGVSQFQNPGQALQSAFNDLRVVNGQLVNLAANGGATGTAAADILLAQAPYRFNSAAVGFDFVRPRTLIDVTGTYGRQRYEFDANQLDRTVSGLNGSFTRRLRRTLDFTASAGYQRRTASQILPGDRTVSGTAGLAWRPGVMLGVDLNYSHVKRSTDAGGFPYLENIVYLGVTYGPPRPRLTMGQLDTAPLAPGSR